MSRGLAIFSTVAVVFLLMLLIGVGCYVGPQYHVYQEMKRGEATLAYAEAERRALVVQAQAEKDAAVLRAEAIDTIGASAQRYPEYREQEYIGAFARCLEEGCAETIIYVPTSGGLPIIEAGRLGNGIGASK